MIFEIDLDLIAQHRQDLGHTIGVSDICMIRWQGVESDLNGSDRHKRFDKGSYGTISAS
jgi:hypothetical protein